MSQLIIIFLEDKLSIAYEKNMNKCLVSLPCWHKVFYYDTNKNMLVIFVIYE